MDYTVNVIQCDVEGGADGDDEEFPNHIIRTSYGRVTAVFRLREVFDKHGNISKDRLTRIHNLHNCLSGYDGDLALELHKDVTLAFSDDEDSLFSLWFGRVQKIVTTSMTVCV